MAIRKKYNSVCEQFEKRWLFIGLTEKFHSSVSFWSLHCSVGFFKIGSSSMSFVELTRRSIIWGGNSRVKITRQKLLMWLIGEQKSEFVKKWKEIFFYLTNFTWQSNMLSSLKSRMRHLFLRRWICFVRIGIFSQQFFEDKE